MVVWTAHAAEANTTWGSVREICIAAHTHTHIHMQKTAQKAKRNARVTRNRSLYLFYTSFICLCSLLVAYQCQNRAKEVPIETNIYGALTKEKKKKFITVIENKEKKRSFLWARNGEKTIQSFFGLFEFLRWSIFCKCQDRLRCQPRDVTVHVRVSEVSTAATTTTKNAKVCQVTLLLHTERKREKRRCKTERQLHKCLRANANECLTVR